VGTVLLGLVACGREESTNAQRDQFAESGSSTRTYRNMEITAVRGNSLGRQGEIVGPQQHLLFFAVCWPKGISWESAGSSSEAGATKSVWSCSYQLGKGLSVKIGIEWDRVADAVSIEGKRFNRDAGNVFMIEIDARGAVTARQNAKVRSALLPDGEEVRLVLEEFPGIDLAPPFSAEFPDFPGGERK